MHCLNAQKCPVRGEARVWQGGPHQPRTLKASHAGCTGATSLCHQCSRGWNPCFHLPHPRPALVRLWKRWGCEPSEHPRHSHSWCDTGAAAFSARGHSPWLSGWGHLDSHRPGQAPAQSRQAARSGFWPE